jgi:molybdopterin converting factor small subunit
MLTHFSKVVKGDNSKVRYFLYGHFKDGHGKLPEGLDIKFVQNNYLTYKKNGKTVNHQVKVGISDEDLIDFIALLNIDITADSYHDQLKKVIGLLSKEFNSDINDAENYYYNNSLKLIKDLSVEDDLNNRTLSRSDFIAKINTKEHHFNKWFASFKGRSRYCKMIRKKYFTQLNLSPKERFFLIDGVDEYSISAIKDIILYVSDKYSKISKRENKSFCPYIYVNGVSEEKLVSIKSALKNEGHKFIDGYDFLGADFDSSSIARRPTCANQIKIKIINSIDHLTTTLNEITATKEVYHFFTNNEFYQTTN